MPHESELIALDGRHIWHPFGQALGAPDPIIAVSGKGARITAADGRSYLDLISSWWVNLHGHAHPKIARAVAEQAGRLEQVIFAGFTHAPAVRLAERLARHLPAGLARVFYSDDGSTAVEVALKLAYQYWRNRGAPRRSRFIAFDGGYHGDTIGALSLGKGSGFYLPFERLMIPVDLVPFPATWIGDAEVEEKEAAALAALDRLIDRGAEDYAALIVEPLVQGAAGMRMCRSEFLRALAARLAKAGVLFICDEVMTGFGRTGAMFASVKAGISPDILCIAKGISGGFVPLSATVCRDAIYEAFLGDLDKAFLHGHSYTANPIACAAGLASLEIFEQERTLERIGAIERCYEERLSALCRETKIVHARILGDIAAFEIAAGDGAYGSDLSARLKAGFMAQGLLLRPLGNVVYLMPPYCITNDELGRAFDGIAEVLRRLGASGRA